MVCGPSDRVFVRRVLTFGGGFPLHFSPCLVSRFGLLRASEGSLPSGVGRTLCLRRRLSAVRDMTEVFVSPVYVGS